MAVPLGEKPSIISYLACSLPHPAGPCKETQLHFYDSELSASLSAFMDFPFSKSSLCGKSLSSSVGSDKYIWYSCALEQKERKKPLYHNLTAGILYTGIETGGWVACAHQIVSRLARSLALEEMRCGFITQQSNLPLEDSNWNLLHFTTNDILISGDRRIGRYLKKGTHLSCLRDSW